MVSTTIEVTAPAQAPAGLLVDGVAVTVVSACTQNGTYVAVDDDQGRTFGVRSDNVGDGDPRLFLRTGQDPGASTAEVTIQRDGPRTTWAATLTLPDGDDIDVALTADPDALPTCNH